MGTGNAEPMHLPLKEKDFISQISRLEKIVGAYLSCIYQQFGDSLDFDLEHEICYINP